MIDLRQAFVTALLCFGTAGVFALAADAPPATNSAAASSADEIKAALPSIPDAKFNLTDFGGVGDYKTDNTAAFKSAVAAIARRVAGTSSSRRALTRRCRSP